MLMNIWYKILFAPIMTSLFYVYGQLKENTPFAFFGISEFFELTHLM